MSDTSSEAFSTSPHLPPELVTKIIRLALPPLQTATYSDYSRNLRAYSLVCSTWRHVAQRELFSCPVVFNSGQADALLSTLEAVPALLEHVTGLRLKNGRSSATNEWVGAVLVGCGARVRELWLKGPFDVELEWLNSVPELEKLNAEGVCLHRSVNSSSNIPAFTELPHLYLRSFSMRSDELAAVLAHIIFPRLRTLAIHHTTLAIFGDSRSYAYAVHQLDVLSLDAFSSYGIRGVDRTRCLFNLPIHMTTTTRDDLPQLRAKNIRLYVARKKDAFGDVSTRNAVGRLMATDAFAVGVLPRLHSLYLPREWKDWDTEEVLDLCLRAWENDVRVVFEESWSPDGDESPVSPDFLSWQQSNAEQVDFEC